MSIKTFSKLAVVAMVTAAVSFTTNLRGETPPAQYTVSAGVSDDLPLVRVGGSEVDMLRQSYAILAVADHDYKGHRVRAMKAIDGACRLLGTDITGEGKGHEKQNISDAQLRQVLSVVEQVRNGIGGSQPKVAAHLDTAIKQLTLALSVK